MTVIALICVDKFGRRRLLYTGAIIMGLSIFTLGVVCHFEQAAIPDKVCVDHSDCLSFTAHNHSFIVSTTDKPLENTPGFILKFTSNGDKSIVYTTQKSISKRSDNITMSDNKTVPVYNVYNSTNISNTTIFYHSGTVPSSGNDTKKPGVNTAGNNRTVEDRASASSLVQKIFGFVALMCYVAAYGFSFGPGQPLFVLYLSLF